MSSQHAGEFQLPISRIGVMNQLAEIGIDGVRDRLQHIDEETRVESELVKSGYVSEATVNAKFDASPRAGVRLRIPGAPHGYGLALFEPESANRAAALMLSRDVADLSSVEAEMAQSALTELGTMMVSGFVDAWADTFDQEIDVQAPTPVHNAEREIIGQTATRDDALGVYVTSRLRLEGVVGQVYLFPETGTFVEIVDRLDLGRLV